ncbi:hypothetical protein Aperf_G00000088135 [Anoplocephala perfoliata]
MSKAIKSLFENGPPSAGDIENFQEKFWEQMVASFSPALKVIDIHDISRHSVLWNINDRLLEVVKSRIQEYPVGDDKNKNLWKRLLTNASSFIHHQYMRGTIMMVLSKMPNIRDKYISLIVNHQALYDDAPLPVLRQIWMSERNTKFKEEVMKIIQNYQSAFSEALLEAVLASVACSSADTLPILFWAPRRRRKDPHLLRLIEMIGDNTVLYEKALQILRNEHAKYQQSIEKSATRRGTLSSSEMPSKSAGKRKEESTSQSVHHVFIPPALLPTTNSLAASVLCSLRFDLLMGLNEVKSDTIFQSDKIHRFVWGMDACIKNKEIDRRHAKDLVTSVGAYQSRSNSDRHPSTSALAGEVGLDQDTSEDWAPDVDEKGGRKKSTRSAPKPGDKRPLTDVDSDSETTAKIADQENRKIKMDLRMVCRDPWVVFTICSTLLKIVIKNGLSEDKLPRNLPDVPFLVNLLMRGLENDLSPPEVVVSKDISASKGESKNKRPRKLQLEATPPVKVDPATALITQVLPAAAQLHLTTWRNQLCERIRSTANQIWSKTSPTTTPSQWQKRLDSCPYTPLTVSPAYLAHPVGHLFIQYHALFALERREWSVLRALLKAAVSAAQARPAKVVPRPGKTSSSQTSPSTSQPTVGFRWRPECLQAIAIGIASLPASSEESAKGSRNRVSTADDRPGVMDKSNSNVTTETPSVASASVTGGGATSPSVVTDSVSNNASSVVTRAELASLLRNSLPLQSDLQLLVLAQCAKLVPMTPTTPTTPGSAGAATPMPNFFAAPGDVSMVSRGGSERERMMNALSRHIEFAVNQEGEDNPVISPTANLAAIPGGFKSTNPKVLEAFEWLKKDMEKSSSSGMIPMMGTSKPACGKPMTPLSPLGSSLQTSQYGIASPSLLMPPPLRSAPRPACYAPNAFPMATPLTNPGLSMPPPPPASSGQMPSSPLADYRPLSPGIDTPSSSSLGGSGSGYPTYATPLATDAGEGGLANYAGSLSPTGGDLRRYAAAPIENRSPSPPLPPPPPGTTQQNSPPSS